MQFVVFLSHFYALSHFSSGSSMSCCVSTFHSFLWPNNIHHTELLYFVCASVFWFWTWWFEWEASPLDIDLNIWSPVGGGLGACETFSCWSLANGSTSHWGMDSPHVLLGLSFMIGFEDVSSELLVPAAHCWNCYLFKTSVGYFYVSLTQTGVIREEQTLLE